MKKNLAKKALAAGLTASMMLGAAACGNSGSGTTAGGGSASSGDGKGDPVSINVMVWDRGNAAPGTTTEDNALTQWIQQQMLDNYNITVTYTSVPRSESDDKLNIMMAGGSAPDIVFTYSQAMFSNFASSGALKDLTSLYAEYGSDIEKYCTEAEPQGIMGDTRYAVMKQRGTENARHTAYIRKDWLDELGMDMPTTKEELGEYLYAVKEAQLGGENTIPWAMSGREDTEKMYLNFIGSYVNLDDDREAYCYNEAYIVANEDAKAGLEQLNKWYKDGLISSDFATDTSEDVYNAAVANGQVGFVLDDSSAIWDETEVLNNTLGVDETFVPIMPFELPDGSYRTPYEYRYAMYVMIPATTDDTKAAACMKYLNWLANPDNAVKVRFTPDYTTTDNGVAVEPTEDVKNEKGYPGTCDDLCIMNLNFDWANDYDVLAATSVETQTSNWATKDWYKSYYDTCEIGKFRYPTYANLSEAEQTYGTDVENKMVQFVYKCIVADDFESAYTEGMAELNNSGLAEIIEARGAYYDSVN